MTKRYNLQLNAWEIGVWISNTTFKVLRIEKV